MLKPRKQKPITWTPIGRYSVTVDRPRRRARAVGPYDRHVRAFLVLGPQTSPHTLRPTIAWGTVRRGVVTIVGGILPDAVRAHLEQL